jgi:RNA polymerase primary sigma factor
MDYPCDSLSQLRLSIAHDLLDPATERSLLVRAKAGDREAEEELIAKNQRLVFSIARRYLCISGDQELTDLAQYGNEGLRTAIEKFDLSLPWRFSTYAVNWIRKEIRRNGIKFGNDRSFSHGVRELQFSYRRIQAKLYQSLGRKPTNPEIAKAMGISERRVNDIQRANQPAVRLDAEPSYLSRDGMGDGMESIIPDPEAGIFPEELEDEDGREHLREQIADAVQCLDPRSAEVIARRFGLSPYDHEFTLIEIADCMGVSKERIRQVQKTALDKLRIILTLSPEKD